ncbi:MAG: hypothetical protein QOH81_2914 [Sphingomonadales bacterium]|jgi:hypothetical protein|nr:hypothetical protein [Sphingomonadales bacterium]
MTGRTLLILLGLAAASTAPALAQTDLDALVTASQQVDTGLALARRQIAGADLLGAAGTLERVLLVHPEAIPPRLLYVSLLCRLDDREGADVELGLLAGKPIADADWAEVAAACGAVPRPAPPGRRPRR